MKRPPPKPDLEAAASAYIATRRGRRAIQPLPPVGRAAEKVLKPLARRFGVGVEQLRENWPAIVGDRLAQWSEPQTVQRSGGINTLVIRARGPAAAVLQAESRRILERVRTYSGARAPTRLRIVQGTSARPAAASALADMPPDRSQVSEGVETSPEARLLSALDRFSRSVKKREG
jgi:hypothetical protein